MLLKEPEEIDYLTLIAADIIQQIKPIINTIYGGQYHIWGKTFTWKSSVKTDNQFRVTGAIIIAQWVVARQLFGCLRQIWQ